MNQIEFSKTDEVKELREIVQGDIIRLGKKSIGTSLEGVCIEMLRFSEYASGNTLLDIRRFLIAKQALANTEKA